ncbi:unnamed protein product [Malus baccata var. baccata]
MVDRDRSGYIDENELQQALSSGYQRFSLRTIRLLIFLFKSPTDSLRVGPKEFAALWTCLGQWRHAAGTIARIEAHLFNVWVTQLRLVIHCQSAMPFLGVRDSECYLTSCLSEENVFRFYKIDPMFSLLQTVTLNYGLNLKLQSIFERYDKDGSGKIDSMELRDALYSLGLAMPPSVLQLLISKYDDGSGRRVELNFDSFVECGMIVRGLTDRFKEKDRRYTGSANFGYDEFMSMRQNEREFLLEIELERALYLFSLLVSD